ncbi:UAP56-interacting factor-like isoform X6 [Vidua chalybeata]|uniref:UAP56-interacting factor-like isoform X6 n=1 Tax=Vidua chalybeata TaxID=81927 RepID=UPI0023A8D3F8|nr:UAP56-interacting factor-like isoform X6 [Vidua chalybeata]
METAGPQPAAGPQPGAEEIDMSLGPNRFRRGFGQQQFNRRQFRNALPGRKRRAAAAFDGVSPLNRQASAQEGTKKNHAFAKSCSGQQEEQPQPSPGTKRFRADTASICAPGRSRPFLLNRGLALQRVQQWFSKARFQRGQMDSQGEGKRPRMRRWQVKPSPGAILTVSVVNPQAGQRSLPGSKRPFLRSQRPPARVAKPQPKGVLLRFNFRAMANQTSLTLDERFSSLRNKRRFTAARSAGRMVTMP